MRIILARHGTAEDSGAQPDPERALVDEGRSQANLLGKVVKATLGVPGAIWSSPLRRAVETAKGAIAAMDLSVEPKLIPDLGPEGDLDHLAWLVQRSGSDTVMLVGHAPDLGVFAARRMGIASDISIAKGGLVIIETGDATKPQGRALASLAPDHYVAILEGREYAPWMGRLRV